MASFHIAACWKLKVDYLILAAVMFFPIDSREEETMNLEITKEEREFLSEVFEEKQKHMIQEINHTDTIDFERMLRKKLGVLEGLVRKLELITPEGMVS